MKKVFSLFALIFFLFLFVQKAEAVYFTKYLTDKITLKEGSAITICPINSSLSRKELLNRPDQGLDSDQLTAWFQSAYSSTCAGDKEDFILARIVYGLRNKENKGIEDYVYIFKNRLYRPDTGLIAFFEKETDESSYIPDGYNQSDATYDVDPSLEEVSKKLQDSGTLWYYGDLSKILPEENLKNLPGLQTSKGRLPIFIFDNQLYIVDSEKETVKDKILLDYSSEVPTLQQPSDLADFNEVLYPNAEFIKNSSNCDNSATFIGKSCKTYELQTSGDTKDIVAFYKSLEKKGWTCRISGKLEGYDTLSGTCEKGNLDRDHLLAHFYIVGDSKSEDYNAAEERRKAIGKIDTSKGLTATSAAQIVLIASSRSEPLVYSIELSVHFPEDESSQLNELNGFPVFPGSTFLGKEPILPCWDDFVYGRCNSDKFVWSTKSSYLEVSDWFVKNSSKFGWSCYVKEYSYIDNTTCKKDNLEYGLSISRSLYTDYVSDSSSTGIYVYIPNKESVASRPHAQPRPLTDWNDFPLYPGISFSEPQNQPACVHLDSDPRDCGMTTRTGSAKGDQRKKIRDWYNSVKSNWKCTGSSLNNDLREPYYDVIFSCEKKDIRGEITISFDELSKTEVTIGAEYYVNKERPSPPAESTIPSPIPINRQ